MNDVFGNSVSVTLSGESHGKAIIATLCGIAPGIPFYDDIIETALSKRRGLSEISTQRREQDKFEILSGVYNNFTTGTPITIVIPNEDTESAAYSDIENLLRPSHADYTAEIKYHGYQDKRGGGHFSGRITAGLVAAGSIAKYALERKGIFIGSHILSCGKVFDREFQNIENDIKALGGKDFAVLDEDAAEKMKAAVLDAKDSCDSIGGRIETAITGLPAGIGEPFFDSVESEIAHIIFSIPAVKGIEFGAGFSLSDMTGSAANDTFCIKNDKIYTKSNNNGGINGGITNGMPVVFRAAVKPTPSISKPQATVNIADMTESEITVHGRHDPAIVTRMPMIFDCAAAIVIADLLARHFGTDFLGG